MLALALVAGCSDGGEVGGSGSSTTQDDQGTTVAEPTRPDGPTASFEGPIEGGRGTFLGAATDTSADLEAAGYYESEYFATGTAVSYTGETPPDGNYALKEADSADYATRIVVRRPEDPAQFNGVVLLEWLNVSGGADAAPDWTYLRPEILREGYAWVGVSAQLIGIEGGPVAVEVPGAEALGGGKGIKALDPERYGDLSHPGDSFAFDIYTQVGRALRDPGGTDPLDGLEVTDVLAVGESQSAFALTTYYNGVQPLTDAFDGFLIHSRGGAPMPIEAPSGYNDIVASIALEPTAFRTDSDTPVMVVETEGDLLAYINYFPARQPEADNLRVWEIAGSAHADLDQVGEAFESTLGCSAPINRGQQEYVLRAALAGLTNWVETGDAPPSAAVLEIDAGGDAPSFVLDEVGNVTGGVRTPVVEAPVAVLSGLAPPGSSVVCLLFGSTVAMDAGQLASMYDDADDYLAQYTAATDAAIEAGFLLEADREAILDEADPSGLAG
ncbi:MAG: alpha/beta hydrolase domain-containing protein [Microthrixaceae bacterium]